jgi:hypothetical protein
MRLLIAGLWLASMLAAGSAAAQPAPFNEVGVTMGHWHLASKDVEANKKIFVGMDSHSSPIEISYLVWYFSTSPLYFSNGS